MPSTPKKQRRLAYLAEPQERKRTPTGDQSFYQSPRWRRLSTRIRKPNGVPIMCRVCERRPCKVTDHVIAIRFGGAVWDERNLCPMCKICHDRKSRIERSGPRLRTKAGFDGLIPVSGEEVLRAFE